MTMARNELRPHLWKSGPDPVRHHLREQCQRRRAQAWYRGEQWIITEEQFIELWLKDDRYLLKGRANHNLCMTRQDPDLDWSLDNVVFITRAEHYQNCNNHKKSGKCQKRQPLKENERVRP
jgi:hypothetical protein